MIRCAIHLQRELLRNEIVASRHVLTFQVDVSAAVAYVMCPKEDAEILTVKKACLVSVDVFTKYLKDQIMEIIDSDKVREFCVPRILFKHSSI